MALVALQASGRTSPNGPVRLPSRTSRPAYS